MKNITLSAPEALIEAARKRAEQHQTTLNAEFRQWLRSYAQHHESTDRALAILTKIGRYASSGKRKFTRDEMNER
jgi:chromosomal replication initiation ATPase DnaA